MCDNKGCRRESFDKLGLYCILSKQQYMVLFDKSFVVFPFVGYDALAWYYSPIKIPYRICRWKYQMSDSFSKLSIRKSQSLVVVYIL